MMSEKSTKEKILKAARKLFVAHGFAGTSMGKIAKLAKVNHSLIFHHFENKEQLWIAVKQNILLDNQQQSRTLPNTNLPFPKFLKKMLLKNIDFYKDNPDIVRMLNWQRMEYDPKLNIGVTLSLATKAWIDAYKHYQLKKEINPKLKVEFIVTMIFAMVSAMVMEQNVFIKAKKDRLAYVDFCVAQLLKGLQSAD